MFFLITLDHNYYQEWDRKGYDNLKENVTSTFNIIQYVDWLWPNVDINGSPVKRISFHLLKKICDKTLCNILELKTFYYPYIYLMVSNNQFQYFWHNHSTKKHQRYLQTDIDQSNADRQTDRQWRIRCEYIVSFIYLEVWSCRRRRRLFLGLKWCIEQYLKFQQSYMIWKTLRCAI